MTMPTVRGLESVRETYSLLKARRSAIFAGRFETNGASPFQAIPIEQAHKQEEEVVNRTDAIAALRRQALKQREAQTSRPLVMNTLWSPVPQKPCAC